jgi:hypothetical protein
VEALSPEEKVLLRLVRKEPIGPGLSACDCESLQTLAMGHKVLLPLAFGIRDEGITDPFWRKWAAKTAFGAEGEGRICAKARAKTVKLLESKGICPILIKGASLSLGSYRDAGDIDLLIPEAALMDAIDILESSGYSYQGFDRNQYIKKLEYRDWGSLLRWSIQFEFSEPDSDVLIELHTAFFETSRVYDEDLSALHDAIEEFAAGGVIDNETGLRFLAREDRALLLALHAGVKRSPSRREFILRHLLDLRALIDAGLDWPKLEQRAFRYGVAHHLLLLLLLNERIAGTREYREVTERIEARLPERLAKIVYLHASCLVGIGKCSETSRFAYRLLSPFIIKSRPIARVRALLIVPLFLPEPHRLREVYGLPPRTPWVYPLYLLEPLRGLSRLLRKIVRALITRLRLFA